MENETIKASTKLASLIALLPPGEAGALLDHNGFKQET
jgi:hypothetical protein